MCPPGLAMASVADHLWDELPPSRSFYFDWRATRKAQEAFDSAFTPAVSLIRGLDVALGMILDGGLDEAFDRHVRLGRAARAGVKAMGLELFSPDDDTSAVVTAVRTPEGIESPALLKHLRERHGVTLAPGQGALKPNVFRIGHIGWFDIFDIATALCCDRARAHRARRRHRARRGCRPGVRSVRAARRRVRPAGMWPEPVERVARELRAAAVDVTIEEFEEGTPTAEAAARAVGCRLDQIVKSILFMCDGRAVLALVPGDRRANEELVGAAAEADEVRVAKAAEVLAATGYEPGAVAPFPLRAVDEVLLEATILQHDLVWIGAGSEAHMAGVAPEDLQRLSGARTADLVGPRYSSTTDG